MAKNQALTDHLIQDSLGHTCNEEPNDVNIFTKKFAHILNFGFYSSNYLLQTFFLFSSLI